MLKEDLGGCVQGRTLERCSADPYLPHHDLEVVMKARNIYWPGDADQGNFLESGTVFARSRVTSYSKESGRFQGSSGENDKQTELDRSCGSIGEG